MRIPAAVAALAALSFVNEPAGPVPPCGSSTVPAYAAGDAEPAIRFWGPKDVAKEWRFPACVPSGSGGFASLVTIAGRFQLTGGADALLDRIGRISALKGVRYWSKSAGDWKTFIEDASALTAPDRGARRPDFVAADLRSGQTLNVLQQDNTAGKVVYRLRVYVATPDRVVVAIENATAVKKLFKTILHPGDAQSVFFFDRESGNTWRAYTIMRISDHASSLATGSPGSSINRAVAYYRHFTGARTDKNPPAAR